MIRLCKNCTEAVHQEFDGRFIHTKGSSRFCSPSLSDRSEAALGIEVWETETPDLVIVGTTDRAAAERAALKYYTEVVEDVPEDLHEAVQGAKLEWINRTHPGYEEEIWPDDVTSDVERPGDSPALIWGW